MTTPNTPLLVDLRGIHTFYGNSHILQGIDLHIKRGQSIGLMGRNGMGKSTLLKTLLGIVHVKSGEIYVHGNNMTGKSSYVIARQGIAYVPEGRGIFGNLSVLENLIMAERPNLEGQVHWDLERVLTTFPRLKERLNFGGQQLSGGEQQMLAIGRALMTNPYLLILDEATEGLAPLIAREIWNICEHIKTSGMSTIIVDKNWHNVTRITEHNIILLKGQIVHSSDSTSLRNNPTVLLQYLGV